MAANVKADQSLSMGEGSRATSFSLAIGRFNTAIYNGTAVGHRNSINAGANAVALGYENLINAGTAGDGGGFGGELNSAIGSDNIVSAAYDAVACGHKNSVGCSQATAFGNANNVSGKWATASGNQNGASGTYSSAIGVQDTASGISASAVGKSNSATGQYSVAFGYRTAASATFASAFGSNITNNIANSVMIGPSGSAAVTILQAAGTAGGAWVGIGTNNPTCPLAVNGIIQAKEVMVKTGWSDYVFDKGYRLAPLSEVEQSIKEVGHLPGIPSAKEVEEKGVSLGDIQSRLLAKIEELTLHQIEQEKREAEQERVLHGIVWVN